MTKNNKFPEEEKFLSLLNEEKDLFGFYDLHQLAKTYQIEVPKMELVLKKLAATRTHFSPYGFKTEKKIAQIVKSLISSK